MYTYLMTLMLFFVGVAVTLLSIPFLSKMLKSNGMIRPNYRGEKIPVSMGICFIPALIINSAILLYCNVEVTRLFRVYILLFGVMSMCFAGIIDDSIGNRDVTGLKGHFKSLLNGKLTTGGFKALLGGLVGLVITVSISKSISHIIVGTLVIALSTNLMNLLDLRPGRAIKVYLLLSIIIFIFSPVFEKELMMLIVPAVIAYFYYDLKAMSMMGDAGSNVLGISIGIFMVTSFDLKVQIFWLAILVIVHLIGEKFSITKLIENNHILNYIDKLGRN
ncbi:MAG: glycosyl transferase [Peptostreptococcus sp.]|uniref:hypothetical protein n=1 Tax=Peptostreptococcus sp. TaxID=1262 RepID=UPI002FC5CFAE